MALIRIILLSLFAASLTRCGPGPTPAEEPQSMLHFIPFGTTQNISLRHARQPVFKVCTQGATNANVERMSLRAVLIWLKASRKIDDQVTREVAISCQNPHLYITMRSGNGVSFAGPGRATFYTGKPFGELVHELGHALAGLADTYVGRQAGNCRAGQPQSNMCWGAYGPRANPEKYSGLWPDDIAGVQAQHKKIFADSRPPANAADLDPEAPLALENPWPEAGDDLSIGQTDIGGPLYIGLTEPDPQGATFLYLSAPKTTRRAVVCQNTKDFETCLASPSKITLDHAGEKQSRKMFKTDQEFPAVADQVYFGFAVADDGTLMARRGFKFIPLD